MDGGAWWAAAHGVAKSQTRLSNFTFTLYKVKVNFLNLTANRPKSSIRKWVNIFKKKHFTEEDTGMANKHMRRYSILFAIR